MFDLENCKKSCKINVFGDFYNFVSYGRKMIIENITVL